jgi:DNA-binding NarL/FixJ family response regulator
VSDSHQTSPDPEFGYFRVLIADEAQDSRDRLRGILGTYRHRIEIVGDAADPDRTTELARRLAPHVVFLDYGLLESLRTGGGLYDIPFTKTRAIVILSSPDRIRIISSFRLGGYGVILKRSSPQLWWNSIVAVTRGKYWLGDEPLAVLIQTLREFRPATNATALGRHFGLTQREIEIVQKIADGRSNKQVGQDFSIRERTVKHHLTNIFSKMGISNRVELALLARDHQLSPSPLLPDNWLESGPLDETTVVANEATQAADWKR